MSLTAEERDAVGAIARAITASESGFDAAVFNVLVEQIRRVATFDVVAISIEDADRMGLRTEGALATPVDVNRLVRTAVTLASAEIRRFGAVDVRYGDIPSAPGAFATLGPVFVSILLAAAQALERATSLGRSLRVDVETLERDGAIVVAIADNGAGIPTGSLPRLFDPFSEGSGDGPTAGLGLALAHDLVRRAGGSIKVESEPGTGTRFEVVLPLADAPAPVVETA